VDEKELKARIKELRDEFRRSTIAKADAKDAEIRLRLDKLVDTAGFPCQVNGGPPVEEFNESAGERGNRFWVQAGISLRWEHLEWFLDRIEDRIENGGTK
jgi:hypothetical protein